MTLDTNAAGAGQPTKPSEDGTGWFASPRPAQAASSVPAASAPAGTSRGGAAGRASVPVGAEPPRAPAGAEPPRAVTGRASVPAAAARPASTAGAFTGVMKAVAAGRASVPVGRPPSAPSAPSRARPPGRIAEAAAKNFWVLGGEADPPVRLRTLALAVVWGALLGIGGLVAAVPLVVGLFTSLPGWYAPTICAIGIVGIACTAAAFASVHRQRLPWMMLGIATMMLLVAFVVGWA